MNVYLASWYASKFAVRQYAAELERMGMHVTSRWLDERFEPHVKMQDIAHDENEAIAVMDVADIEDAEKLVLFTIDPAAPPHPRGGRHFESGYFYALTRHVPFCGRKRELIVCGPRENIFHHKADIRVVETWEDCKVYLKEQHEQRASRAAYAGE